MVGLRGKAAAAVLAAHPAIRDEEEDDTQEADSEAEEGGSGTSSSENSDTESQSSSEEEDEDPEDNTVDVTLEFFDPKEKDFHGLKALLQSYLDGQTYACSGLVDAIIKQSTVGTVVKSADGADPIGVLTVLNTERYKHLECLQQIRGYLVEHCSNDKSRAAIQQAWDSQGTGLLVNERLINCPPQLAPPLQQALFDEIAWATEDEPTQELKDSFKLEQFIALSRVFADPSTSLFAAVGRDVEGSANRHKKQKVADPLIVYARPEDECYHRHCSAAYTFPTGRGFGKDELQPMRLVMLLSRDQSEKARKELDETIGNVAAQ